mgnify:CR=1 FL=1
MIFVFTAIILFHTFIFWHVQRLNRMAEHINAGDNGMNR